MGKRRQLNKARVVAAAARLANASGSVNGLSLKAVAADLDIRVPSLYNHIDGVDGLQRDLMLYGLNKMLTRLRAITFNQSGRPAIIALAGEMRNFAHEQPAVYLLTVRAPTADDAEHERLARELVHLLQLIIGSLGLTGEDALHAIRGLRALIHGFVAIELAGGYGLELDKDLSFRLALDGYLSGILPTFSAND